MDKKKPEEKISVEPIVEETTSNVAEAESDSAEAVIEEVPIEPTIEDKSNLPEGPVGIIDGADTR